MRDDRKREHREIGWGVGKQARKQVEEGTNRGEREMPIKGEKRKASRDKKKETWKMEGKIRVTDSAQKTV